MAEKFLIRTQGGPLDGETRVANAQMDGVQIGQWEWPLPARLPFNETGDYVKVTESSLPPMPEDGNVMRGATYAWEPNNG